MALLTPISLLAPHPIVGGTWLPHLGLQSTPQGTEPAREVVTCVL